MTQPELHFRAFPFNIDERAIAEVSWSFCERRLHILVSQQTHHALYRILGINQHDRQLTVSLRNHEGDVILARQVSTRPAKVQAFFDQLTQRCVREGETFVVVVAVCGFNDSLVEMLREARFWRMFLEC